MFPRQFSLHLLPPLPLPPSTTAVSTDPVVHLEGRMITAGGKAADWKKKKVVESRDEKPSMSQSFGFLSHRVLWRQGYRIGHKKLLATTDRSDKTTSMCHGGAVKGKGRQPATTSAQVIVAVSDTLQSPTEQNGM